MRIVQLTETLAAGGAETFVVRLSNALAEAGHEVTLAVMNPVVHPALEAAIAPNVRVEHANVRGWRWWWRAERVARTIGFKWRPYHALQRRWLRSVIQKAKPHAIHSHLLMADLLAIDERHRADRCRHVITIHGDYLMYLDGAADPLVRDLSAKVAKVAASVDAIVGVAASHLDRFRRAFAVDQGRLHLIYNGYDAPSVDGPDRAALALPADTLLFGMVSRGIEEKGWKDAIDAFQAMEWADAALVFIGEGEYLSTLRQATDDPRIHFAGFAARPIEFIRQFDCCLLPSFYPGESLPTVVTEYLACGKPVVATEIGEVAAMLRTSQGQCAGQLVRQRDVAALAQAMDRVAADPALRQDQSAMALDAFTKFSMATCVERYVALYGGASA